MRFHNYSFFCSTDFGDCASSSGLADHMWRRVQWWVFLNRRNRYAFLAVGDLPLSSITDWWSQTYFQILHNLVTLGRETRRDCQSHGTNLELGFLGFVISCGRKMHPDVHFTVTVAPLVFVLKGSKPDTVFVQYGHMVSSVQPNFSCSCPTLRLVHQVFGLVWYQTLSMPGLRQACLDLFIIICVPSLSLW